MLFPAMVALFGRRRHAAGLDTEAAPAPKLAIVLSAYNEENHIADRIRNLLELDYPAGQWRAYVGVDGCKDRTAEEAEAAAAGHANLVICAFAENRGKVAVLKDLVSRATHETAPEILVFTDANTMFAPDALRRLTAPFSDTAVGGVCGKLRFIRALGGETEENVYWRLENWLKAREGAIDSCLGANGAIYAIRTPLFWKEIPSNTIIDDFVIGMKVREQGWRMIYEPRAVAVEELPSELKDEWKRRVRIGAGDFQALELCGACLKPSFGLFAWMFWSHKVLRWFTPHLVLSAILLAAIQGLLMRDGLGTAVLWLYAAVGLAALAGMACGERKGPARQILRGIQYLIAIHTAIFVGFVRFCRGNLQGRWERSART
jgi:cellulose synthase/poly-beta-1,6-N-acetylglucosamine synthase-like glycosyltransferase